MLLVAVLAVAQVRVLRPRGNHYVVRNRQLLRRHTCVHGVAHFTTSVGRLRMNGSWFFLLWAPFR